MFQSDDRIPGDNNYNIAHLILKMILVFNLLIIKKQYY